MTAPTHILEIGKSTGGVGVYMRWLAEGFDHARYRLTFVCLSEGGPELAAELGRIPGVQAMSLAMNRYKLDPLSDARALGELRRIVHRVRPDLIHAHASKPGYLARLAAGGTPVLYSPHCFSFHDGAGRAKATLLAAAERLAARHLTTRIVTVCDGERDLALRWRVGRPELFRTVLTGIDPAPFAQPADRAALRRGLGVPEGAPLVGAVGRLITQKAPLDFVRAAANVHAARPDAHFVWVGDGPLMEAARAEAAALGVADAVHFVGPRRDVPALLQALDLFVLPSRWEGFALSVLEAMAAGLPVVATAVTGADEAVAAGESGLIVPPGDIDAMARAMREIITNPDRGRAFGAHGRERVAQRFTRERMIGQLGQLYDEIRAEHQQRRLSGRQLAH